MLLVPFWQTYTDVMVNLHKIIVTGASSGIGRAICERLLHEGHTVIGMARDFSKYPCTHEKFTSIEVDFSDLDALPEKLQFINKKYPDITGVVCCAGKGQFGSLEEFSYDQIRSLMDLNFISQAYITRTFLPYMKRSGAGRIIFVGSEAALSGSRKGAIYCASKFALRGMAQALRDECARNHVHISIINPGMVNTDFFDDLDFEPGEREENYILPENVADAVSMIINSRDGTVYDEINLSPLKKVIQTKQK